MILTKAQLREMVASKFDPVALGLNINTERDELFTVLCAKLCIKNWPFHLQASFINEIRNSIFDVLNGVINSLQEDAVDEEQFTKLIENAQFRIMHKGYQDAKTKNAIGNGLATIMWSTWNKQASQYQAQHEVKIHIEPIAVPPPGAALAAAYNPPVDIQLPSPPQVLDAQEIKVHADSAHMILTKAQLREMIASNFGHDTEQEVLFKMFRERNVPKDNGISIRNTIYLLLHDNIKTYIPEDSVNEEQFKNFIQSTTRTITQNYSSAPKDLGKTVEVIMWSAWNEREAQSPAEEKGHADSPLNEEEENLRAAIALSLVPQNPSLEEKVKKLTEELMRLKQSLAEASPPAYEEPSPPLNLSSSSNSQQAASQVPNVAAPAAGSDRVPPPPPHP
jgi:hypothetical protein